MLDLADLGKYRENNRIEAKKATGGFPKSLWESYSAFANTIGGIILLGVEEKADGSFERAGLKNASALLDEFWQKVNDKTIASKNILSQNDQNWTGFPRASLQMSVTEIHHSPADGIRHVSHCLQTLYYSYHYH